MIEVGTKVRAHNRKYVGYVLLVKDKLSINPKYFIDFNDDDYLIPSGPYSEDELEVVTPKRNRQILSHDN